MTTDRAATLHEQAERLSTKANKLTENLHDLAYFVAKDRLREAEILDREAAELRRMADETATEHRPAVSRWRVETLDNLAGEWAPGTGWPVRALAVERFDAMNAQAPRWKDGTPVTRRLVRETTTYTVEAETGPDAGARQDEPPTPSLRDQHRAAWHALTPDQQTARIAELDAIDEPAAGARQDEPAPGSTQPRPCRAFVSGGTVWCCEEGETDCPCVCHQPAAGARQDGAES